MKYLSGQRPLYVLVGLFLLSAAMLNGCAWLTQPPQNDAVAQQMVGRWMQNNSGLKSFKGLMQLQIEAQGRSMRGRAAFAAVLPDRLRVELLNTIGQPLFSLASDGEKITLISMQEHVIRHLEPSSGALEPLIGIPLGVEDLLSVLIGRPPLPDFAAAQAVRDDIEQCTVLLKNRWHERLAQLHSGSCERIETLTLYDDRQNEMRYAMTWIDWQTVGPYILPRKATILAANGVRITITVERYWPDISVPADTFTLVLPENFRTDSVPK
ncbi:MAG: hypothetical protein VR64_21715 [Desulfatitalea sp. BRH_c12]|nr:MAG: hypothetical protein VR64_21715 [Desulfatitalea sp. BRH_c12]